MACRSNRRASKHAEEHQPDPHARGKQHREPAGVGIVRRRIRAAQPHLAHRQHDQHEGQKITKILAADRKKPVEGRGKRGAQPAEEFGRLSGRKQRVGHERPRPTSPRSRKPGCGCRSRRGRQKPSMLSCPMSYSVSMISTSPSGSGMPWFGVVSVNGAYPLGLRWVVGAPSRATSITDNVRMAGDPAAVAAEIEPLGNVAAHDHEVGADLVHRVLELCGRRSTCRVMGDDGVRGDLGHLVHLGLHRGEFRQLLGVFLRCVGLPRSAGRN